ncbi:unnamed protein product [Bemisia tabaci]|uniref:Cleavage and polyadenylation specificity factor subunit 1 n=1 Tax=Bemisia tabaci TaxID=7038 RepID=A0A9N9ZZ34_BEMTA|nr:unnamed protein product [Bemisia tabaci]
MFSIYKQTHPPTAVEHAVSCHFFNRFEKSLVVVGANVVRVYGLIPDFEPQDKKSIIADGKPPKLKLECLAQYSLFGNIMSIQAVALNNSVRDSLIISFKDAKLSIVEYDPDTHDLRTLFLQQFETEDTKGGWTQHYHIPSLRVDPEGRCAVMLLYGRKLLILPFRKETVFDDPETLSQESKDQILDSYIVTLAEVEDKMDNVIDIQFLHGYYEPTLLILYEPMKTFSGRISVRRDTCVMVAISLNLHQKVHPVIWSVSNLPFDCSQAIPVSKPLGGVLIFAINSMIYLNQSVPPYGVSLNSIAHESTSFPLKKQEGVVMTLEGAKGTFIATNQLVISLKGGELYVMTLFVDSMRSIRNFHFEKSAASVLTICLCLWEDSYLFLGSRLGNSLLLKFYVKEQSTVTNTLGAGDQPSKKRRLDALGDWMASDVSDIRDIDELEVYGTETATSLQLVSSYVFEVCDSLLNVGPIGQVSMGEPAFLSEEFINTAEPDVELVTTSGYGKNGALCVLQRSLRPQVITTFELPGCLDMWTVIGNDKKVFDEQAHSFLILSQADNTMVLKTDTEINEVENSGFFTQDPTIFAGNLGGNKFIIQVSPNGVRLLQGAEQVQHIPLDLGSPLIQVSLADPYVIILTEDRQILLLTLRESRLGTWKLVVTRPSQIPLKPYTACFCLYRDVSGLFSRVIPDHEKDIHEPKNKGSEENARSVDDEDELLYGDSSTPLNSDTFQPSDFNIRSNFQQSYWWQKYLLELKPTYWLVLARQNGLLEIYSVPDFKFCYAIVDGDNGSQVMKDSLIDNYPEVAALRSSDTPSQESSMREILLVALGNRGSRPLLLIRLEEELFIYQVFRHCKGGLKLRFSKIPHNIIFRGLSTARKRGDEVFVSQMRYFSDISGYNGVFISGPAPHWLFLTSRGELRTHPMSIDGPVACFAPFHNVNCPQGFVYFNRKSELRISILPTHLSYDAPWPVRKVPVRCTPHFVAYHLETKTYCIVTSTAELTTKYYKFNGEDKELSTEERDERFPWPYLDKFTINLFSPVSWELIPNTNVELEEWEHALCLKNVSLAYEGTRSGFKGYMAVGTNYNYSEDITSKGRILLFDIIEVVPEPGQPLTKNKIKVLYSKEQKGPVSAINHVLGFLVSAVGQKIYIWQLKDNDLVGIAFIDTQVYVHQLLCIKSLILIADVYKSITLLRFQEEYRTLSLVSRDFRPAEIYAVEFLLENSQMGFLVSDREKNIVLYMYQPESLESMGGQKLLRKADFHVGQHINSFFRIRCRTSDLPDDKKVVFEKRHVTMFATLDGGLGFVLPVSEKTYRRLLMLQNVLHTHIPHTAALNPRAYRVFKSSRRLLGNPSRGIVDGELVFVFLNLSIKERIEVGRKIGSKVDDLLEDIIDVHRMTAHF